MKTLAIEKKLNEFIESAKFSEFRFPENHKLLLSDGCKYVLDECDAEWLFDTILFFQLSKKDIKLSLQVWTFCKLPDGRMKLSCEDERGQHILGHSGETIDFLWDEMKFVVNDDYIAIYDEIYYEPE